MPLYSNNFIIHLHKFVLIKQSNKLIELCRNYHKINLLAKAIYYQFNKIYDWKLFNTINYIKLRELTMSK